MHTNHYTLAQEVQPTTLNTYVHVYIRTHVHKCIDVVPHHLCDTEAVSEVVEGIVPVVLLDPHQPALQDDRVDVEVFHKTQLTVHVFQKVQHLDKRTRGHLNGIQTQHSIHLIYQINIQ